MSTLECFLSMVPSLTQTVLTQKLVPLLAKIRTKGKIAESQRGLR